MSVKRLAEILWVFLRLGCTSFGGPVAHLGYFRNEFVVHRRWLSESAYADLVALCQFLPGPASSQVGFCIGFGRGGIPGGISAWLGFTAPSVALMICFAYGVTLYSNMVSGDLLRGFKILALAVVAQAVLGMARILCPDWTRAILATFAAGLLIVFPAVWIQLTAIILGGLAGYLLFRNGNPEAPRPAKPAGKSGVRGTVLLALFFALLFILPASAHISGIRALHVVDSFYRTGSLVFGGGHVVLPLIQAEVVPPGWVTKDAFIAGYGAAQAVPGPLFSFSAYVGAVMDSQSNRWAVGVLALVSIYLPSLLLVLGVFPYWESLRAKVSFRAALRGTNAVVVGILFAALYSPVWTQAVHQLSDFLIAVAAFCLLQFGKVSVVMVLAGCAAAALIF